MPAITIITPVFNGARFISECVENVWEQAVPSLEHVVVDGDSTDGTKEILADLANRYPQLRVVSERDRGQSDAMNKGIRFAASDIVGILNVDDFYEPGAVKEGLEYLHRHPKIDFVTGDCNMLDESGVLEHVNRPKDLRLESLLLGWGFAEYPVNPCAYFYRKNVHDKVGGYRIDENFAMDVHFLYDCAASVKMAYVPRRWGNFRHLPGTKTVSNRAAASAMMRAIREERIAKLSWLQSIRIGLRWRVISLERSLRSRSVATRANR